MSLVEIEIEEAIATVTMNRPDKRNAMLDPFIFSGERGVTTWKQRVRRLEELGFISSRPGASGNLHYLVIRDHHDDQTSGFSDRHYNALLERHHEIGATDLADRETAEP